MRYIKPTDFKDVREFQQKYRQVENNITELIATGGGASTAGELQQLLSKSLSQAMQFLTKVNKGYTDKVLPTAFEEGGKLTETPKMTKAEASAILERQGFKYSKRAFSRNTYIELQTATQAAEKGLKSRVNKIVDRLRETGEDSLYNVQQTILKDLQENGLLEVRYANGARQRLDTYAAMAARSARIETANIGAIGRALQSGTDLVKMTTMPQCCKLCGAYQDKVYSISGKDKRFPALFKTVLRRGYALPHPNCRHEFIPYFIEIEDPADVERMIKQSKIKYDSKGNLVDVRYQRDIELYQAWQAGNRQRNDELLEFEQMRAYYESRNEEPPYKTIGAFRRARRAQSESYKENRQVWKK